MKYDPSCSTIRRARKQNIWIPILICLALLNVTACGTRSSQDKSNEEASTNLADNARELARKTPNDENFTVNPATLNKEGLMNEGDKELFPDSASSVEERVSRLESNVQRISDTLARMSPKITKLMDVESELGTLTFQLEEIINRSKSENIVPPAPMPMASQEELSSKMMKPKLKAEEPKTIIKKPSIKSGSTIHNLRVGDHSDKLRVVFETIRKLDYQVSIDNTENIMIVTFPEGDISRDVSRVSGVSKAIKSISQNEEDAGISIIFELSSSIQRIKDFRISPNDKNMYHRIVIDLINR